MTIDGTCKGCDWWCQRSIEFGGADHKYSLCLRRAPVANIRDMRLGVAHAVFPHTRDDRWCGEFKPRED